MTLARRVKNGTLVAAKAKQLSSLSVQKSREGASRPGPRLPGAITHTGSGPRGARRSTNAHTLLRGRLLASEPLPISAAPPPAATPVSPATLGRSARMASVDEIWSVTYRHHRAGHECNNVAVSFMVAHRAFVDPSKLAVYDGERSACTNNATECTKTRGTGRSQELHFEFHAEYRSTALHQRQRGITTSAVHDRRDDASVEIPMLLRQVCAER